MHAAAIPKPREATPVSKLRVWHEACMKKMNTYVPLEIVCTVGFLPVRSNGIYTQYSNMAL